MMCGKASRFLDSLFLVQSRLNPCSDLVIRVRDTLGRRLGCSGFQVFMTLTACILGEVDHGLERPLLADHVEFA
jgi:hypothetical protein